MPHSRYTKDEIAEKGEALYERALRAQVENERNVGKIISIDIENGDYSIGDDVIAATRPLREKRPDAAIWTKRIGFNAVYALGGTLTRTTR
jgi:hypothetical protein